VRRRERLVASCDSRSTTATPGRRLVEARSTGGRNAVPTLCTVPTRTVRVAGRDGGELGLSAPEAGEDAAEQSTMVRRTR
jgi:hypothetical protein